MFKTRLSIVGSVLAAAATASIAGCGSLSATSSGVSTPGVTKTEIVVGATTPFTGPAAAYSEINQASDAYFKYINAHGGIYGRKIHYIMLNDSYDPAQTVADAKQLVLQDHVFTMMGTLGTPTTYSEKPFLQSNGVGDITPETGGYGNVVPRKQNWFALEPNYTVEGEWDAQLAVNKFHAQRIAVWYQNDVFGQELLYGLDKGLAKYGLKPAVTVPYEVTQTNYTPDAVKMNSVHPDLVILYGVPGPEGAYVAAQYKLGYHPTILSTYVDNDPVMESLAGAGWNGVYVGAWLQNYWENTPAAELFRKEVKKYYPNLTDYSFAEDGWVDAQVFVHALKLAGPHLTRASLNQAMESIHNYTNTLAAGPINYSATNHWGFNGLYLQQYVDTNGQWSVKNISTVEYLKNPYSVPNPVAPTLPQK